MDPEIADGVITVSSDATVDRLLRRVVACIEERGYDVIAVIDHSGEAADAGLTMPDSKLLLFGRPKDGTALMLVHPLLALDLPLKLLIFETADGDAFISYLVPEHLADRYGLSHQEADALRVVEAIAHATSGTP